MPEPAPDATPTNQLLRGIRPLDLALLIVNGIIGAGIFGLPSKTFAQIGTWSLLAFLACALIVALVVLCFAEVSSRFRETGGPYLYARRAFGPAIGFQVGWLMWLSRITAFASVCNLLVSYVAWFWPTAETAGGRAFVVTAVVTLFTTINMIGIRKTAMTSNLFAVAKLVPLVLFIVVGLFFLEPERLQFGDAPPSSSFMATMMIVLFGFSGFEVSTISSGEVLDPRRAFPRALFIALGIVVTIYLGVQVVCIGTLSDLGGSERPLADAAVGFVGTAGAAAIVIGGIISMSGNLSSSILGCTRLPFAMAEQGQLPRFLGQVNARFHTPTVSILFSAAGILAMTLAHSFLTAAKISTIAKLLTYVATCAALPVLRRRGEEGEAGFRVPLGGLVAVLSLALCTWLLATSTWEELRDVGAVALIGVVVYLVQRARSRRGVAPAQKRDLP